MQKLNCWFITGFCDGESSFMLNILKNSKIKTGWEVRLSFEIHLNVKDLPLLSRIQSTLGVGNISQKKKGSCTYYVNSVKDLIEVINHFDKYPLITQKLADYLLFKRVWISSK